MKADKPALSGAKFRLELQEALKKLRKQRNDKLDQITVFTEAYGKKLSRLAEPERGQKSLRDFILEDVTKVTSICINQRRDIKKFQYKKQAKIAGNAFTKRLRLQKEAEKNRIKQLKETAKTLSRNVYKTFWQTTFKIHKFSLQQHSKLKEKENQKKRLNALIKQQLLLSSQLASVLASGIDNEPSKGASLSKRKRPRSVAKIKKEGIVITLSKERRKGTYSFKNLAINKRNAKSQKKLVVNHIDFKKIDPHNIKAPILLRGTLRNYQFQGLKWLLSLHQKKLNGILADEMGLGKTIQTIALLSLLAGEMGIWGPHLVIVPTTLLLNWEMEFKRWCPGLKIFTYFGRLKERKEKRKGWSQLNSFHVCITSYKIATLESKVFRRRKWYYMVLDEAQQIKNSDSQTWQCLVNFQTQKRLLLTGTPLQNDLIELWSLLAFLMPNRFHSHSDFKEWFSEPLQRALSENRTINKEIIQNLHKILRPFLLRRLKKEVEKELPTKVEVILKVPLSMRQKYLYDEFINHDVKKKSKNDFLNLMNLLMQLRKTCNHPDLIQPREAYTPHHPSVINYTFPLKCMGLVGWEKNENLKYFGAENGMTKIAFLGLKKLIVEDIHTLQVTERLEHELQPKLNEFNIKILTSKNEEKKEFITTRLNNSRRRVILQELSFCHSLLSKIKIGGDPSLQRVKIFDFFQSIISGKKSFFTSPDLKTRTRLFLEEYEDFLFIPDKVIAEPIRFYTTPNLFTHSKDIDFLTSKKHLLRPILEPFYPFLLNSRIQYPKQKNIIYDSGKLNRLISILRDLRSQGHKCLIFTQMSKMLNILEAALSLNNFSYIRLDGSTKTENRQPLVELFNSDPKIFAFISSTRSGGIGLNLTSADTVIFYDSDWNPAIDKQAQVIINLLLLFFF